MANTIIDISELEYLKSRRDKLRDIAEIVHPVRLISNGVKEEKGKNEEMSAEDKLLEIKKIIKN